MSAARTSNNDVRSRVLAHDDVNWASIPRGRPLARLRRCVAPRTSGAGWRPPRGRNTSHDSERRIRGWLRWQKRKARGVESAGLIPAVLTEWLGGGISWELELPRKQDVPSGYGVRDLPFPRCVSDGSSPRPGGFQAVFYESTCARFDSWRGDHCLRPGGFQARASEARWSGSTPDGGAVAAWRNRTLRAS